MNLAEFEKEFNETKNKYNVVWEWNCDLETIADGMLFYKEEDDETPFCGVVGIGYDRSGSFGGDFEGFIEVMKSEFKKEYGF
ncbi:hypothetical protein NVP1214O_45 [Vibrio phage 1.214.O._10N.222.54.F11]|nr:hypothetical protein NVP1013O_44 [Vibrio phage 1.013.O._10N.286.54.F9]AUR95894.1 hypothetical protein NVP1214O_45 [Vibrio phage 1.214.O._10N.222.54.F11]